MLVRHLVNMRKREIRVGARWEGWWIKRRLWKAGEWNPGDIYSSEREHERSLGRKVRGKYTGTQYTLRWGGQRLRSALQTLSPVWLWNPAPPCKTRPLGCTRVACAQPLSLTWPVLLSEPVLGTDPLIGRGNYKTTETSGSSTEIDPDDAKALFS